ncbi:zinc-binding dehydrogenase [Nocardioides sp. YIM 152588]|uniref:zinc-binding dehydrogenase n=1 Tax=Nocardioides sp. YIM 152588 TaxID=3158259 RepID=UPI0032E3B879
MTAAPTTDAATTTMRAVTLRDGTLGLHEVPRPVPGPGQVLVRTLACAICASDHHYMDHPEVAAADRSGARVHAPEEHVVMGHEYCAELVAYGPDTQRAWPLGTRLTSPPALFSGGTIRIIGMAPDAPGGFGEYFLLSEVLARPLPDDLEPATLSLIDALAVGWYYTRLGTQEANRVPLVVGLGAIGLGVVLALKQRGSGPVVAADHNPVRRELAARLGADVVVDPATEPAFAAWRRAAWGSPAEVHDRIALSGLPTCSVYECVGRDGVLADLVDGCPNDTRILSAGGAAADTIPSAAAHLKGVNLQFGGGPAITDWYETLDLVASGTIDPSPLIGETVGIDGLAEAIDRARRADAPPRIVFTASPRGSGR